MKNNALRYSLCSALLSLTIFCGCGNDKASTRNNKESNEVTSVAQKQTKTSGDVDVSLNEKTPTREVPVEAVKKKVEKSVQIEEAARVNSGLKGKTCDDMLKEYGDAIDLYLKDKSSKLAKTQLKELRNDPNVRDCRSQEEFKSKFKLLDKKMYSK